jgi:transcriptional regulator with XRE-family HTH domain
MGYEPQRFTAPDGTEMVVLRATDFERLKSLAEDSEDVRAAEATLARIQAGEGTVPGEVVHLMIVDGLNPVAAWRRYRGLSQSEVARRAGLSQVWVSRIEAGGGHGTPATRRKLAKALDAPLWALEEQESETPYTHMKDSRTSQSEEFAFTGEADVFVRNLLPSHREILLDVVLKWAMFDCAMTEFLGAIHRIELLQAFDKWQKNPYKRKLKAIIKSVKELPEYDSRIESLFGDFEKMIQVRHRIVHAGLNGYRKSDPDYLIFFLAERDGDGFVCEEIPIQEMARSTCYAEQLTDFLKGVADLHYRPRTGAP